MKDYLKHLKLRRDFLKSEKERIEKSLVPIIKELKTVEELISISGGGEPYPRNGSIRDKVFFILKEIKKGTYMDISKAIVMNGDLVNPTSLKLTCATLARDGSIKVIGTSERSNIYSL